MIEKITKTVTPDDGLRNSVPEPASERPAKSRERLPELTFGRKPVVAERVKASIPKHSATPADSDLSLIEAKCRLKAKGAKWVARRHRRISAGANFAIDIEPIDRELISEANALSDCFLWMCHPESPSPSDFNLYEDVGSCFEIVADVIVLLRQIQDEPHHAHAELEKLLNLLAEAQSSLRVAIATVGVPIDTDQMQVFRWLKATADEKRIFIERYMKIEDHAEPSQWGDLYARVEAMGSVMQETRRQDKQRAQMLEQLRQLLSRIATEPTVAHKNWPILVLTVDELVSAGLPPSNRELREMLVPVIDSLPDLPQVPDGVRLVLREIDRFLATNPPPDALLPTPPTPEVQHVARLLKGRSMVLIGGDRRPASYQALKDAFNLADLTWIETKEHESIDSFESCIARADVAVIVLAIRWSSHSFGEVREFCDRHGKPLVRLPGGYNPNQVASQIMTQCSHRLLDE